MRVLLTLLLATAAGAQDFLATAEKLAGADKASFARMEGAIRNAGTFARPDKEVLEFDVTPQLGVLVRVPKAYTGKEPLPLVFAFGGGPIPKGPRGDRMTRQQARMMLQIWREAADAAGHIVAAVRDDISRSDPGIRYEIVRPHHLDLVLRAIRRRVNVDEDRTVMTGISLGSNYALACGAARPQLFAGAIPVSTEGEGRAPLLRNLRNYPVYVLEGALDRNIRGIAGPRALHAILDGLGYKNVYEEYADRGHEGFPERYPAALKWFAERPRIFWAREVLRVPHGGIMAPGRTFHWITCDTRQGVFRARVEKDTIAIEAARLSRLELLLSDHLVDLDREVTVTVNGKLAHRGRIARDPAFALAHVRKTFDRRQVPAARLVLELPTVRNEALVKELTAQGETPPPELAYWEHFALQHLRATRTPPALDGEVVKLGEGRVGLRLATGKLLTEVEGNPFFEGDDPKALLQLWHLRGETR